MLVKLQTTDYLIYAELNKAERVTHLASRNRIPVQTCYAILHEIEARGDYQVSWGLVDGGYTNTVRVSRTTTERKPKLGLVSTQDFAFEMLFRAFSQGFFGKLLTLC